MKPTGAFIDTNLNESIPLAMQYMVMTTGDYDGDGISDVAVTGVFPAPVNATTANDKTPVDIYLGDGNGGLRKDGAGCPVPTAEKPVYLLPIPGSKAGFLVATLGANVYHCYKVNNVWTAGMVGVNGPVGNGFKQLALANDEGKGAPDLLIRTNTSLFADNKASGNIDVRRKNGLDNYAGPINITNSNATWMMPYRFAGAMGDSIALTWDDPVAHPGAEFHYIRPDDTGFQQALGSPGSANTTGIGYGELNSIKLGALAPFHIAGQTQPAILYTFSLTPNSVSVLSGAAPASFGQLAQQKTGLPAGILMPYAGDANGDGQDEIGLYTIALNGGQAPRHLELLSYKNSAINATPIVDISFAGENVRGMALEYLGGTSDPRTVAKRKDLIALIEDPAGGGKSRLLVRRANLNYMFP